MTTATVAWRDELARRRLLLHSCKACGVRRLPWVPSCPDCGAVEHDPLEASGVGTVYSWATMRHPADDPALPLTIAAVTLEEGPVLFARLSTHDGIRAGLPVEAVFEESDTGPVVSFVPAQDPNAP